MGLDGDNLFDGWGLEVLFRLVGLDYWKLIVSRTLQNFSAIPFVYFQFLQ